MNTNEFKVQDVQVKNILSKPNPPAVDSYGNPYAGCTHAVLRLFLFS